MESLLLGDRDKSSGSVGPTMPVFLDERDDLNSEELCSEIEKQRGIRHACPLDDVSMALRMLPENILCFFFTNMKR